MAPAPGPAPSGGLPGPSETSPTPEAPPPGAPTPASPARTASGRVAGPTASGRTRTPTGRSANLKRTATGRTALRRAAKPAGVDPRLIAAGGLIALFTVGGLFVVLGGKKPSLETASSSPTATLEGAASTPDELPEGTLPRRPEREPVRPSKPGQRFSSEEDAYDALAGGWGETGAANPTLLADALTARGRQHLFELAFEGARATNPGEHAALCTRLGLEGLPSQASPPAEWAERYAAFAALAPKLAFRGRAESDEPRLRILSLPKLWLEIPVAFVDGEASWQADFPTSIWKSLNALQNLEPAREALARGEAAKAYALVKDAPPNHRPTRQVRVNALDALSKALVVRAQELALEDSRAAAKLLDDFQAKHEAALDDLGIASTIAEALVALRGPDAVEEPAERAAAFATRAKAGLTRVASLRGRIVEEKKAQAQIALAELARARAASVKSPIDVPVTESFVFRRAILVDRDAHGFKIEGASGELYRTWDSVPRDLALDLRRLGVRKGDAGDQLRFGFWALRQRRFRLARRAFKAAAELDPTLGQKIPDVDALEAAAEVFAGRLTRSRSAIALDYDFQEEGQAKDWSFIPSEDTKLRVHEGALEVGGAGVFLAATQEIAFDGRCELEATIAGVSPSYGGCFGIGFDTEKDHAVWYFVAVNPSERSMHLYQLKGGKASIVAQRKKAVRGKGKVPIRISISGNLIKVSSRGKTQITAKLEEPSWNGTRVFVGGVGSADRGAIRLEKIRLKGRVRQSWMRKSFARLDALLFKALSRSDELPVFSSFGRKSPAAGELSAEDAFGLSSASPEGLEAYRAAHQGFEEAETWAQLFGVAARLSEAIETSPGFAAPYYLRARLFNLIGAASKADEDLEIATRLCPRFFEAQALRARVLADLGQGERAMKLAELAIKTAPGEPDGYAARGLVRFSRDELQLALGDFEVARALAPHDEELVGLCRNVQNVLRGPPWAKTHAHETPNYSVVTNVSAKAARRYGELLEAARKHYLAKFPLPEGHEVRKSKVLIFDTEEGYHGYADLSTSDRVESTLGCYLPRYRQLLLYEVKIDRDQKETIETLIHEGFHQFMHQLVPDNAIPYWLNEGLAEFMSAVEIKDGEVVKSGLVLEGRLSALKVYVQATRGQIFPFPELMRESPQEFYAGEVWAKYAQAWAMVHYFELGAKPSTKQRYQRYVKLLREGTPAEEAFETAWSGAPWGAIQERWWTYVNSLK